MGTQRDQRATASPPQACREHLRRSVLGGICVEKRHSTRRDRRACDRGGQPERPTSEGV